MSAPSAPGFARKLATTESAASAAATATVHAAPASGCGVRVGLLEDIINRPHGSLLEVRTLLRTYWIQ